MKNDCHTRWSAPTGGLGQQVVGAVGGTVTIPLISLFCSSRCLAPKVIEMWVSDCKCKYTSIYLDHSSLL